MEGGLDKGKRTDSIDLTNKVVDVILDGGKWSSSEVRAAIKRKLCENLRSYLASGDERVHDGIVDFLHDREETPNELGLTAEEQEEWLANVDAMVTEFDHSTIEGFHK